MISPISFGSVYKIKTDEKSTIEQRLNTAEIDVYCKKRRIPYFETSQYAVRFPMKSSKYSIISTVIAPDKKDADLESFMASKGIQYKKYEEADILKPEAVIKRVKNAPKGFRTAIIDSEKLDKILTSQEDNNFRKTREIYQKQNKKETQLLLKSMDEIPASTLYITTWNRPDETVEYIRNNGSPEKNSIVFNFEKLTDDPDNCIYFAMKGIGMKDIPVYLDDASYLVAYALGIIKEKM